MQGHQLQRACILRLGSCDAPCSWHCELSVVAAAVCFLAPVFGVSRHKLCVNCVIVDPAAEGVLMKVQC